MSPTFFFDNLFWPIFIGMALIALGVFAYNLNKKEDMKSKNFAWYKDQYPDLVSGSHVKCNQCGSSKIAMRNVGEHFYMRAHACVICGTNLYYSPER